ncbi:EAL domain-containing protein [Rhodoferax sp.]|uniref:bifunctional diguanylate cyclase/phosphodiesterase n=2 Tax=Rhodoferax sp. TaxID=50421 RepID=UPI002601DD66|nr:EAL domain-containing protein [Rhodoferax sp.]
MRLRNQLFWVITSLFVAVLMVILLVSTAGTRRYLEQQLASHAQDAASALSISLSESLGKSDSVFAETQVLSVFDRGYFQRIDVLDTQRNVIVTKALPTKIEGVPIWFVQLMPIHTPAGEAFIGSGWRQLGKVLVVSQPTYAYQHLWRTTWQLLLWLLAICLVALLLLQVGLRLILKPLRAIEYTAHEIQAKKFIQIDQRPKAPELASVVMAMNQMSKRVGEMLDAETARAESLRRQAFEDDATGLANRRGFELRLTELLTGEFHFDLGLVISVELDDMRLLNRHAGFAAGAGIMQTLADEARATFGHLPSTILARSNEFSFSFVLADISQSQATELAQAFRASLMQALSDNEFSQQIGIQVGAVFFTQRDSRSDVFARADLAVETARQSERNGFALLSFQPQESSSLGSFAWRTLIATALTEKRWRLLTQPVVALDSTKLLLQSECMARLVDAHGALVPAASFLPMAARHRLMPDIDKAMLTLAFDHLKAAPLGAPMLAVNLSPQSIADPTFVAWFERELTELGNSVERLAIEISEFGAIRNLAATVSVKDFVQSLGGQFGIDHFGLEPQALTLLREMLPNYVKLTGSLSADLVAVETSTDMLSSFVSLAHSLDVMVIAQQVENKAQVTTLRATKVDAGQGYYFGAPK